jgi:hemolysin activation/secretion protein
VSLVASYSSVRPDRFAGRNFLTSQLSLNFLGSNDEEISLQRETAESNYWVERLQFARIQPLKIAEPDPEEQVKQWIVFLKVEGQYASGALIPAEQKAVGGLDNVRGYTEREVLGDNGVSGTIELRSPILIGDITSRFGTAADAAGGSERLQMVGFVDAAYLTVEDTLIGQEDTFNLLSVGLGFRAAVTRFTQLKFDWGFPIEETEESDSGGRGHISFEVQI